MPIAFYNYTISFYLNIALEGAFTFLESSVHIIFIHFVFQRKSCDLPTVVKSLQPTVRTGSPMASLQFLSHTTLQVYPKRDTLHHENQIASYVKSY